MNADTYKYRYEENSPLHQGRLVHLRQESRLNAGEPDHHCGAVDVLFLPSIAVVSGDYGHYVFSHIRSPLNFFNTENVNVQYFSEKVVAAPRDFYVRYVDTDKLYSLLHDSIMDTELDDYTKDGFLSYVNLDDSNETRCYDAIMEAVSLYSSALEDIMDGETVSQLVEEACYEDRAFKTVCELVCLAARCVAEGSLTESPLDKTSSENI